MAEPNPPSPTSQDPNTNQSSQQVIEWHRIVQVPEDMPNLGGNNWKITWRNLLADSKNRWRIFPYEEFKKQKPTSDNNELVADEPEELRPFGFVAADDRSREVADNWNLEKIFDEVQRKWREKGNPRFPPSKYKKEREIVEENAQVGCLAQTKHIESVFLHGKTLFPHNQIRRVYFLFNDSIAYPLSKDSFGKVDLHERDTPEFDWYRIIYELRAFKVILDSVLRGWSQCKANGCKKEEPCLKLQVWFNDPFFHSEFDRPAVEEIFKNYMEDERVDLVLDNARDCCSLAEIAQGQPKEDACRQRDALVVSFRPTNPIRQILADIDRGIQKRIDEGEEIRNSVLAVICPPVLWQKANGPLPRKGSFRPFNTPYDIVTNRVVKYFDKFAEIDVIPYKAFPPELEHGLIRPFSLYRLVGPAGLLESPKIRTQMPAASPSTDHERKPSTS